MYSLPKCLDALNKRLKIAKFDSRCAQQWLTPAIAVLGRYVSVRYFHSVRWHNLCFNAYHLGINRAVTPISLLSSSWELLLPRSSSRIWLFSLSLKYFFGCVLYFNSALRREASTSLRLTHPFCPATSACLISFELVGQGDQTKPKVTWFQFLLEVIREILWHICTHKYVCVDC